MDENNFKKREPTKLQIDDIIPPSYTELSKRDVAYIKKFEYPPKYIADMLQDLADSIMFSYPEFKDNNSDLLLL